MKPKKIAKGYRAAGRTVEAGEVNLFLDHMKKTLLNHYQSLSQLNDLVTPDMVRDKLLGRDVKENTLLGVFSDFIEQHRKLSCKSVKYLFSGLVYLEKFVILSVAYELYHPLKMNQNYDRDDRIGHAAIENTRIGRDHSEENTCPKWRFFIICILPDCM